MKKLTKKQKQTNKNLRFIRHTITRLKNIQSLPGFKFNFEYLLKAVVRLLNNQLPI